MEELEKIQDFIKQNKLVLISYVLIILLSLFLIYIYLNPKAKKVVEKESNILKEELKENEETVFVDIKGAVNNPGTYEVLLGKRVKDVIDLAGGVREDADTSINNLSLKVRDEMSIIIYTKEEIENFTVVKEKEKVKQDFCSSGYIQNDSCISYEKIEDDNKLISINTATLEELKTLPGVGDKKAQDIIDYRLENGLFNDIEDIKNVNGIGDNLYDQIKDYITT